MLSQQCKLSLPYDVALRYVNPQRMQLRSSCHIVLSDYIAMSDTSC